MPQAAQLCTSCHGQNGVAIAPIYPSLAGQHEDYLVRALDEYQKGGRKNPIMKRFAATLRTRTSARSPTTSASLAPLQTEPRPYTRFGAVKLVGPVGHAAQPPSEGHGLGSALGGSLAALRLP